MGKISGRDRIVVFCEEEVKIKGMKLIVDLHVHSRFSRATGKDLNLPEMYKNAKLRGINVLGTGDFTHPKWNEEMREQLEQVEGGLYRLKKEWAKEMDEQLPMTVRDKEMRFIPTVEISNIYKRHDKVRRLHNVIVAPSLETVAKINVRLEKIGNLHSDGRPILGLDSEELLKLVMGVDENCMFIPAHIWTPWFAMFGSKSGFDSLEEAFGESKKYIKAVETGLSADPKMCRMIAGLDDVTLVSNSDAHSCGKLGREANMMDCEMRYEDIKGGIETGDGRFVGTIEFYPEEGKYHEDGHVSCGVKLKPDETKRLGGICPVCHQGLTVGVLYRVQELAEKHGKVWGQEYTHEVGAKPETQDIASLRKHGDAKEKIVKYIVPLPEILAEIEGVKSTGANRVKQLYLDLMAAFGPEFNLLLQTPIAEIGKKRQDVATAIEKMRTGDVFIDPGYDGVFGKVRIFGEGEGKRSKVVSGGQMGLW